jgi:hypothetical protein
MPDTTGRAHGTHDRRSGQAKAAIAPVTAEPKLTQSAARIGILGACHQGGRHAWGKMSSETRGAECVNLLLSSGGDDALYRGQRCFDWELRPHLSSWAGRSPLDNQSGKRTGRSKSKKGNRYLAAINGETAIAADKTQTREGARYRRLARRRGKPKAQVAVGNTQLKVYHKLLSNPGMRYADLGADYYERQRDVRRQIAHHVGKLGALGFEVTLCRLPDSEPAGTGTTQAT